MKKFEVHETIKFIEGNLNGIVTTQKYTFPVESYKRVRDRLYDYLKEKTEFLVTGTRNSKYILIGFEIKDLE